MSSFSIFLTGQKVPEERSGALQLVVEFLFSQSLSNR
jgi:hypothetical protein